MAPKKEEGSLKWEDWIISFHGLVVPRPAWKRSLACCETKRRFEFDGTSASSEIVPYVVIFLCLFRWRRRNESELMQFGCR